MSRKEVAVTALLSCSKGTTGRSARGRITGTSRIPTCSSPASWAAYPEGGSNRRTTRASTGWSSATGSEAREASLGPRAPLSAQYFFGPEQPRHGLGVGDLPLAHPGERRGERKREHLEELLFVELRALVFEPFREVDLDPLVRIRDRYVDRRQVAPLCGGISGFLLELAFGGSERIFVRIDLARGDFDHVAPERIAVLALHHEFSRVGERDHCHRAGVLDVFAFGRASVGQLHRVAAHLEQLAVVDQLARDLALAEILHRPLIA